METDKIASSYRKSLGEVQTVVEAIVQNDGDENIVKVLSNGANGYVDEVEMLNGEAHYMGGVVFDLLFVDETGASHVLSEKMDLNGKIENDQINPLMKPIYSVETLDCKLVSLDDGKAKLAATIAIKLDAVETDEIEEVKTNNENIQLNKETVSVYNIVSSGTKTFDIDEEFDAKVKVNKVLLNNTHVDLKNVVDGTGYFTVDGNVFLNSLFEVEEEEIKYLKNFMQTLPFKEEFEDEIIQHGDEVFAFAYIRPQDVSVNVVAGEENKDGYIKVHICVTVKYLVQRLQEEEINTDAFSMTHKTNIKSGTFLVSKPQKVERFLANIEGQSVLDENEPRIAKVCAVTNEHLLIANSVLQNGELTIEGVAYMSVLYLTDDDIPVLSSVNLEIPFANKFGVDENFDGNLYVISEILDVEAKAKKGKEINVSMEVCFLAYSYLAENNVVIKDIELTEQWPKNEYSLEMYVAPKGSTLWDISKHLLANQETLLAQNPELVFPLEEAQTIVHFKQNV